ncbi:MAG TPA: S8 family serine peptidase [Thermoanaerobaculia bacterium]|nr:S8 family serine peptidase [Thermoanaerobaculia bacterium]
MRAAALAIVSLFAIGSAAQTTSSTMCQATEVVVGGGVSERKLVGCGEGFPDNLLWHLDRADSVNGALDGKVTRRGTGRGVVIYFIDTGVLAAHTEFARAAGSNVIAGIPEGGNCPPTAPCWFIQSPFTVLTQGHGTGVASVAAGHTVGIAPDASIVAVQNSNDVPFFKAQLERIIAHAFAPTTPSFRTAIINISAVLALADPHVPELDALIRRMTTGVNAAGEADPNGKRFFFSVIAGNKYSDPLSNQCGTDDAVISYPSTLAPSLDGLVAVGGIDRENHYWSGSCRGSGVELLAPAPDVFVASISSNDAYRFKPAEGISGTSWSAPYVSGIAALLLEIDPNRSPAELEALLKASPSRVAGLAVPIMPGNEPTPPTGPKRRSARH